MRKRYAVPGVLLLLALTGCGTLAAAEVDVAADPTAAVCIVEPTSTAASVAETDTATAEPHTATAEPSAEPTAAAVAPGTYTWESNGTLWMVMLRDTGLFTLMERTENGDNLHSGEGWQDNGDGTVTCGPAQIQGEVFCRADGSSVWKIRGDALCEPILP